MENKNNEEDLRLKRRRNKMIRRRKRQMRNRRRIFFGAIILILLIIFIKSCRRMNNISPSVSSDHTENQTNTTTKTTSDEKPMEATSVKIGENEVKLENLRVTIGNYITDTENSDEQNIYYVKNEEAQKEILDLISKNIKAVIPKSDALKDILSDYVQVSFNDSTYLEMRSTKKSKASYPDINIDGEFYYLYLYEFNPTNHVSTMQAAYLSDENLRSKIEEILAKHKIDSEYKKVAY